MSIKITPCHGTLDTILTLFYSHYHEGVLPSFLASFQGSDNYVYLCLENFGLSYKEDNVVCAFLCLAYFTNIMSFASICDSAKEQISHCGD